MTGQQRAEWEGRARTPETRAEIRRWSGWETVSFWLLLTGGVCALAAPIFGLASAIVAVFDDRTPSWMWALFGPIGIAVVLFLAGGFLGSHAKERRLTALYADGTASVGTLTEVVTHPGGGDDQTTYEFLISAELPNAEGGRRAVLYRRLFWGEEAGWISPERWVGRQIRFRHNTLDPDDLYDVRFDGWPGRDAKGARS